MINFSDKQSLGQMIELERISLRSTQVIQKNLNKQILIFMKNFIGKIDVNASKPNSDSVNYIKKSTAVLSKSNFNLETLQKLIKYLTKLSKNLDKNENRIKAYIEKYNLFFSKSIDLIYSNTRVIEKFIYEISTLDINNSLNSLNSTLEETEKELNDLDNLDQSDAITSTDLNSSFVENTLIISDTQKKVLLPYKIDELQNILLNESSKYSSLQDVIDKLYSKPLNYYSIASFARFKEAYNLVVKERDSKIKAFSLASELFFNYNLHPAIITACKTLDELDIYLACLEDNTLEDFKFFNIKFEISPAILET